MLKIEFFRPDFSDAVVDIILPIQTGEFGVDVTLEVPVWVLHRPQ